MPESSQSEDTSALTIFHCTVCGWSGYLPREACPQCHRRTPSSDQSAQEGTCIAVTHIPAAYSPAGVDTTLALVSVDVGATVLMQADSQIRPSDRVSVSLRSSGMGQRLVPVASIA
jgi:uncharacterized OB-fold protein